MSSDLLTRPEEQSDDPAERLTGWLPGLGITIIGLVALAFVLRMWELGDRAFHHDESLDAWWSWRFRNGTYPGYDPVYHGPLRFYITAGFYEFFGENETTARLFSALTGTAAVGLPWFLRHELGKLATFFSALALAISPTMLYYSRFGREDAQMVFLALLALVLVLAWLRRPRTSVAAGLGFVLAASFAIKESTYLFGLLLAIYALIVITAQFDRRARLRRGETVDGEFSPAFFGSAMAFASFGLIATVVIGAIADELFGALFVFGAALGVFALAVAMDELRSLRVDWPAGNAVIALSGLVFALGALAFLFIREQARSTTGPYAVWALAIGAVLAIAGLVLLVAPLARDDESDGVGPAPFAGALFVAGLLILLTEFLEMDSAGVMVPVVLILCAGLGAFVAFRPRVADPDWEWPPAIRALGAIGWWGWFAALTTFVVTWLICFTVFGTRKEDWASGFTRAIDYWDSQQEVNRGGQPWYYYLFALPIYEWLFVALAVVGSWRTLRRPTVLTGMFLWFSIGSMVIYSYAGERMPWLIAHPLLPVLVLAGLGVAVLWQNRNRTLMPAIGALVVLGLIATTGTSLRASFPNGTDAREILSQAGQATPHVTAALERFDNIDRLKRQATGESAVLAIERSDAWPYSWYLREDSRVRWFDRADGPPTDIVPDVIIANVGTLEPADWPSHQATRFAMRSWWVPTYTQAGPLDWVSYARDRTLWDQHPNLSYVPVGEVEAEGADESRIESIGRLGDGAVDAFDGWLDFAAANGDVVVEGQPDGGVDAGRDGCGSVDQWFMVVNDLAGVERQVHPGPIAEMGPLACASDAFAAP